MDEDFALSALIRFVDMERDWVPFAEGTSLYLRPFLIGNDETLGVHSIRNAMYVVIASPVGSYYPEGINPVKIMIETADVRAVRGEPAMPNAEVTMLQATAPERLPSKRVFLRCCGLTA